MSCPTKESYLAKVCETEAVVKIDGCRFAINLTDFSDESDFPDDTDSDDPNESMTILCDRCDRFGHPTETCNAKTRVGGRWLTDRLKQKPCRRCGWNDHAVEQCIATNHRSGYFIVHCVPVASVGSFDPSGPVKTPDADRETIQQGSQGSRGNPQSPEIPEISAKNGRCVIS